MKQYDRMCSAVRNSGIHNPPLPQMWTVHFSEWRDVWCGNGAVCLWYCASSNIYFHLLFSNPKSLKGYYKWVGQIKTDHLFPFSLISALKKHEARNEERMVCYKSWQQWNLLHLQNYPVPISGQHILYGGAKRAQASTAMKQQYTWLIAAMRVRCSFL